MRCFPKVSKLTVDGEFCSHFVLISAGPRCVWWRSGAQQQVRAARWASGVVMVETLLVPGGTICHCQRHHFRRRHYQQLKQRQQKQQPSISDRSMPVPVQAVRICHRPLLMLVSAVAEVSSGAR